MSAPLTVQALARAKGLPADFLTGLGVEDARNQGVLIPYFDRQGQLIARKKRTALKANEGSFWPSGVSLRAYGEWKIPEFVSGRRLILVEGESDCWALWFHGQPALGVPGASCTHTLTSELLESFHTLYVHREPDQGGDVFVRCVGERLARLRFIGQVFEVRLGKGVKDPADLHVARPGDFDLVWAQALRSSKPLSIRLASLASRLAPAREECPPETATGGRWPSLDGRLPPSEEVESTATGGRWPSLDGRLPPSEEVESAGAAAAQSRPRSANPPSARLSTCLDDVQATTVEWLWPERIPLGKLTILDGDPGLGKSTITLDWAARVTRGLPMPHQTEATLPPSAVVLLTAEDGLADTIRPRLEAAGADLTRVFAMESVPTAEGPRPPVLPLDAPWLRSVVAQHRARLVIVDPLMAYLGTEVNAHNDQNARRALFPLAEIAQDTGAAVVVVRHLNKNTQTQALYRGGGSIGILGAARSALLVAPDPDDPRRRLLAVLKANLARKAPTVQFELVPQGSHVQVAWLERCPLSAEHLLQPQDHAPRPALEEAEHFLRVALADGPRRAEDVSAEARALGIADRTLRRARQQLGVKVFIPKGQNFWLWTLASEPTPPALFESAPDAPPAGSTQPPVS